MDPRYQNNDLPVYESVLIMPNDDADSLTLCISKNTQKQKLEEVGGAGRRLKSTADDELIPNICSPPVFGRRRPC